MMLNRILLIGEAPNRRGQRGNLDVVLACRSAGIEPVAGTMRRLDEEFPLLYDFAMATRHVNLLHEWPGKAGRGSAFPLDDARQAADRLMDGLHRGLLRQGNRDVERVDFQAILVAGRRAAGAMGLVADLFERVGDFDPSLPPTYVVPHPSKVNGFWNKRENRNRTRAFLEWIVKDLNAVGEYR